MWRDTCPKREKGTGNKGKKKKEKESREGVEGERVLMAYGHKLSTEQFQR